MENDDDDVIDFDSDEPIDAPTCGLDDEECEACQ